MPQFSTIGIITKRSHIRIEDTLNRLNDFLLARNLRVLTDENAARVLGTQAHDLQSMCREIELAIVVGGDGTLLHAGRVLADHSIPILGVNLGRLGFLVDVSPDEMTILMEKIFAGEYQEESRLLLSAEVYRGDTLLGSGNALNDVVLHVRNAIRMIEFTTHINGSFVNTQRADGIVVTTPTGSTAYALSGGGPILHPELDAVGLVPICPHTLSNRPIMVKASDTIEITLCKQRNSDARVSFDGQTNIEAIAGDRIVIKKKNRRLCLIHPKGYDYYHILRAKLRWSVQP